MFDWRWGEAAGAAVGAVKPAPRKPRRMHTAKKANRLPSMRPVLYLVGGTLGDYGEDKNSTISWDDAAQC